MVIALLFTLSLNLCLLELNFMLNFNDKDFELYLW